MPNRVKIDFIKELTKRYGKPKKLPNSLSLFEIGDGLLRIYVRYSKIHGRNQSFYGIRKEDLKQLDGFNSIIVFLWNTQIEPLFVPYSEFEEIFDVLEPASDGQIKASIFHKLDGAELYISNAGRYNVEAFFGWKYLEEQVDTNKIEKLPDFSHSQIQTLIGSIGNTKGFDIWIPSNDRNKLDWNLAPKFHYKYSLPERYSNIIEIIKEVDILWLKRGSSELKAMFEVEHSTPIYSGLLRFNDLYLVEPNMQPKFSIVSNELRKSLFLRQINRPTFKVSGLSEICNFLEYKDVFGWFNRIKKV